MNTRRVYLLAFLVLVGSHSSIATGANKYWKNSVGSGAWSTNNNWSNVSAAGVDNGGAPGNNDTVRVSPTDGVARTITLDTTTFLTHLEVDLTGAGAAATTLSMSTFDMTSSSEYIGFNGRGVFNHSGGTNFVGNVGALDFLDVGVFPGAVGTYNLSGTGAIVSSNSEYIGDFGTGFFNHTGGTNTINGAGHHLYLGFQGGVGTYTISGGSLTVNAGDIVVGNEGIGVFTQTGGSNTINGVGKALRIGYGSATPSAIGTYNLSAGSLLVDFITMGDGEATQPAYGYFNQTGGDVTVLSNVAFGGAVPSLGVYSQSGGTLDIGGLLHVGSGQGSGEFTLSGSGELSAQQLVIGVGVFTGASGTFSQTGGSAFVEDLAINNGTLNLSGGLLRFNTYFRKTTGNENGVFNFVAGTIQLAGNRGIGADLAILEFFGVAPTLVAGKGLAVEGTATLQTAVTLDGGMFSAAQLVNPSALHLQRGTFNLTNQAVTIGAGGLLGSVLDVNDDMTVNVTLGMTNQGLVTGDGQIGGTFANAAAGELRGEPGKSLKLTGANNANAGRINLLGGLVEFTQNLTNSTGALISGNGSLRTGSGLVNQGTMNFAGTANVLGDVTNDVGGKIISGGGGATIFYDDVANNGEIRTSANGFTVFFGSVSGSGTFTGTGTVNFEGDLSPGSSPAAVNFAGDVVFGPESALHIELGGTTPGAQYDQLNVAGELTLAGTLQISLINGFTPTAGQMFDFLNGPSFIGDFSSVLLPDLPGLAWNTSQIDAGMLSVALPGDFDFDGDVDGRDFLVWQRNPAVGNLSDWQANYGTGPLVASVAVPEPCTALLLLGCLFVTSSRTTKDVSRCKCSSRVKDLGC